MKFTSSLIALQRCQSLSTMQYLLGFFSFTTVPSVKSPKIRQVLTIIHEDEEKNKQQMCCFDLLLLSTCYNVLGVLFVSCVTNSCIIRCTFVVPRVILCAAVQTTNMSTFLHGNYNKDVEIP